MKKLLPGLLLLFGGIPFFTAAQPVHTLLVGLPGTIRISNDSLSRNYNNITLDWSLLVNGFVRQKGSIPALSLLPGHPRMVRLPVHAPADGEEAFLKLDYRRLASLATQVLPLKPWGGDLRIPPAGEISFTDSGDVFTIHSPTLNLSFDKESGWIRGYEVDHYLLLADTNGLRPVLPGLPHLQLFSTSTGSQLIIVRTEYTVPELSCLLHLSYTVNASGSLLVDQTLETDTTRTDSIAHPIDRLGMRWMLPTGSDSLSWYGLTPEEHSDSLPSLHSGLVAAQVRWWSVKDANNKGFQLTTDSNFLYRLSVSESGLHIDEAPASHPTLPIHDHLAFKITPISSVMVRPATPVMLHPATPVMVHPATSIMPRPATSVMSHPASASKPNIDDQNNDR